MHVKRRRLPNFEACSVALFASLAMGAAALPAARTQISGAPTRLLSSTSTVVTVGRTTPRAAQRSNAPEGRDASPDGSVSSPGFDESLK